MRFLFTVIILSLFLSCKNDRSAEIDIQTANPVFGERWALICEPYVAYRVKPSHTATVAAHGRQGDIVKLDGTHIDVDIAFSQRSLWYQFPLGWLPERAVEVYSNRLKAEFAAGKIK